MNEQRVLMRKVDLVPGGFRIDTSAFDRDRHPQMPPPVSETVVSDDGAHRRFPRRRRYRILPVLLVAISALGVWSFVRATALPVVPAAEAETSARAALYLIANSLDDHRRNHGVLPASLTELGVDIEGVSYRIEANRYVLKAAHDRLRITYREGQDKAPFAAGLGVGTSR